jgi:hypothetical protein
LVNNAPSVDAVRLTARERPGGRRGWWRNLNNIKNMNKDD